ncbi:putative hydro-lyase [Arabidopsis thaliana]|uniref:tryptophan synthase n=2 Tax=Arabidopsis TaxID=3701 RepID=A0A178UFQ0_ARATH|nr:Tryptophan synthase beta subunit-like PLP-dependent enzyme [Arabidopsis thaliana x Arabidopsis arenosa]OAO92449.1 TSBtype2 [Arabidopsis thaliana]
MASQLLLPPNQFTKSVSPQVFITGDCQGFSDLTLKRKSNQATRVSNGSSLRVKAALRSTHNKSVVEIPKQWYNLVADLSVKPPPPLHPKTFEPIKPEDLAHLFPNELIKQEATQERFIDIPEEVLEIYKLWRPTPLIRAKRLEKLLQTPARIYFKYEGGSPAGSHKPNTAVPQAYYNAKEGIKNVVTETGAGQWGSSLAFASSLFGLDCEVWQVANSYHTKPYRRLMMQTWGAKVHPSPSDLTEAGRRILESDPSSPGSLGIAISEAVEVAARNEDTKYCLGSVLNHVLLHQTIIGEECIQQMENFGETPDLIIGCTGGGSNFAGLSFPFIREKLKGKINPVIRAVEPSACPSLTKGVYAYDFGDTAGLTPLMKMHTLGHDFIPDPIHAGGLRYHGMAPLISHVYEQGFMEAISIPQIECFQGAIQFARTEGIIPAPEPTHAIAATIREALRCKETGEAKVILMAMCGHGHFDLTSYDKYLKGELVDLSFSEEKIRESLSKVPHVV